eukprot:TRINITY_DN1757_c0_g1_i1.p1 TRINITY_DN1757_c0_g1~~TRINITY_DN1757_c0_g1_i1.p1  ORF type:complete len:237 (-),score=28.31 TRINITY_DN1757_c0_g1_i1:42-752(-)
MHDGQNLFIAESSFSGVDWGVSRTISHLASLRLIPEVIVVGIWNTEHRLSEYLPGKPYDLFEEQKEEQLELIHQEFGNLPSSDDYLRFIVEELKPFIDFKFRSKGDQPNTFTMGSSMGGLIACYTICEYPNIFHGAACLSTHWPCSSGIMVKYLEQPNIIPDPANHKLYFDLGTDPTDEEYHPFQLAVNNLCHERGYVQGKNFAYEFFEGEDHSEMCWRNRLYLPILFFLGCQIKD